jgi:hypothetical protein
MQDFEFVDFTAVSEFERLVIQIQQILETNLDATLDFESTTISCRSNQPEFSYLNELLKSKELVVLEPESAISSIKMVCSAIHLANKELSRDTPFIVGGGNGIYQGLAIKNRIKQNISIVTLDYVPNNCVELKGLVEIFKSRIRGNSPDPIVSVVVHYHSNKYPFIGTQNWSLRDFEKEFKSQHCLRLQIGYENQDLRWYLETKIDPTASEDWALAINSGFYCASTLRSMLEKSFQAVEQASSLENHSWNYSYIPGGFEMDDLNEPNRFSMRQFVDTRDIDNAIFMIFEPSLMITSNEESDISSVLYSLRFKQMTTPKNSIIWKFAYQLFDSLAAKPSFLSFRVSIIPLVKGIWSSFLRQIQSHWDKFIPIPNVDIKIGKEEFGIQRDHILIYQKLCMLNCCIHHLRKQNEKTSSFAIIESLEEERESFREYGMNSQSLKSDASWEGLAEPAVNNRKSTSSFNSPVENSDEMMVGSFIRVHTPTRSTGRKKKLEGILSESGEPIWEPTTLSDCPMTDDMIQENEKIIQQLGNDLEGQAAKIRLQSIRLISGISGI